MSSKILSTAICAVFLLGACAPNRPEDGINDRYEPISRRVHDFNRRVDANLVKPLSAGLSGGKKSEKTQGVGSRAVEAVGNFGKNLALPGKAVNHLLQGKPAPAIRTRSAAVAGLPKYARKRALTPSTPNVNSCLASLRSRRIDSGFRTRNGRKKTSLEVFFLPIFACKAVSILPIHHVDMKT